MTAKKRETSRRETSKRETMKLKLKKETIRDLSVDHKSSKIKGGSLLVGCRPTHYLKQV
jgi:hypothetical protein